MRYFCWDGYFTHFVCGLIERNVYGVGLGGYRFNMLLKVIYLCLQKHIIYETATGI